MSRQTMSFALPASMREYIDDRAATGNYGNTSEHIRGLLGNEFASNCRYLQTEAEAVPSRSNHSAVVELRNSTNNERDGVDYLYSWNRLSPAMSLQGFDFEPISHCGMPRALWLVSLNVRSIRHNDWGGGGRTDLIPPTNMAQRALSACRLK